MTTCRDSHGAFGIPPKAVAALRFFDANVTPGLGRNKEGRRLPKGRMRGLARKSLEVGGVWVPSAGWSRRGLSRYDEDCSSGGFFTFRVIVIIVCDSSMIDTKNDHHNGTAAGVWRMSYSVTSRLS